MYRFPDCSVYLRRHEHFFFPFPVSFPFPFPVPFTFPFPFLSFHWYHQDLPCRASKNPFSTDREHPGCLEHNKHEEVSCWNWLGSSLKMSCNSIAHFMFDVCFLPDRQAWPTLSQNMRAQRECSRHQVEPIQWLCNSVVFRRCHSKFTSLCSVLLPGLCAFWGKK